MSQLRFLGQEGTGLGNCRCFTLSLGSGAASGLQSLPFKSRSSCGLSLVGDSQGTCSGDLCEGRCWLLASLIVGKGVVGLFGHLFRDQFTCPKGPL